jgi:hypothetical protein
MGRQSIYLRIMVYSTLTSLGCSGMRTERVEVDPQTAANEAIRAYDENGNKTIEKKELEKCPALLGSKSLFDSDKDDRLNSQEIAARIEGYTMLSTHIAAEVRVVKDKRPVEGALVTLEPEPFLGAGYPTYQGKSDQNGLVALSASPPTPGIAVGLYRVVIACPDGTNKVLGCEIADDVPSVTRILFSL